MSILFELMTDSTRDCRSGVIAHQAGRRKLAQRKEPRITRRAAFLKESLFKPVFHDLWGSGMNCKRFRHR